jgi:hypothetical protein
MTFSLTETAMKWVPENLRMFSKGIESFFTTNVFAHLFPDILKEYG